MSVGLHLSVLEISQWSCDFHNLIIFFLLFFFLQDGSFALACKSRYFPGEVVATRFDLSYFSLLSSVCF